MKKFVPYEKLSKKMQKELSKRKRTTWGYLKPCTRKNENKKAYNRKRDRKYEDDIRMRALF